MDNTDVSGVTDENLGLAVNLDDKLPKTQEELDELIGREKLKERDKLRREMEARQRQESINRQPVEAKPTSNVQNTGGVDEGAINGLVDSKIEQILQERQKAAQDEARKAEMQRIADTYYSKLKTGGEKYNDFDEITGDLDESEFPLLVHAVAGFDNLSDIMYELANNPHKLEKINSWLRTMPERGIKELRKLSDSLRETDAAISEFQPTAEPLSQTKPSNVSVGSGLSKLEQLKQSGRFKF